MAVQGLAQLTITDLTDKAIASDYPKTYYMFSDSDNTPIAPSADNLSADAYCQELEKNGWVKSLESDSGGKYLYQIIVYGFTNDTKIVTPISLIFQRGEDGENFGGVLPPTYAVGTDSWYPTDDASWSKNLENIDFNENSVIWERIITITYHYTDNGERVETQLPPKYTKNLALTKTWLEAYLLSQNKALDGQGFINIDKSETKQYNSIRIGHYDKSDNTYTYPSWNMDLTSYGIALNYQNTEVGSFKAIKEDESLNNKDIKQTLLVSNQIIAGELKFRTKNNEKFDGRLGIVAQSNYHLSLKEV